MKLEEAIYRCMAILLEGHESEETGEIEPVEETTITWGTHKHGEFEITIRKKTEVSK